MHRRTLDEVFAIVPSPNRHTYVDRGGLDQRVQSALASGLHVVMHGESKHGKSWLRAKTLPEGKIARVQCMPGMSASTILEQALSRLGVHEPGKLTIENSNETQSTTGGGASAGVVKVDAQDQTKSGRRETVEQQPVGQDLGDLGWVAGHFRDKNRIPVFEDFHNLDSDVQFTMAYVIKALGEWQVPCVIIGIWTNTHLLKLYNGELDGRIEDLALRWTTDELKMVVRRACKALNVDISEELCQRIVRDAYTSVGLLQELTKATLAAAGIDRRGWQRKTIDDSALLTTGRARVLEQISSRFAPFVQQFPGATAENVRPSIYPSLTTLVTEGRLSESELLAGIPLSDVHSGLLIDDAEIDLSHVIAALKSIEVAQRSVDIRPPVLAYDAGTQRLILADRRLLLYLRERPPV